MTHAPECPEASAPGTSVVEATRKEDVEQDVCRRQGSQSTEARTQSGVDGIDISAEFKWQTIFGRPQAKLFPSLGIYPGISKVPYHW
jgi:hypothetical protein